MTPEQLTAVLGAVAVVVTALVALVKQISAVRDKVKEVLVKAESIEKATDGAATVALATKEALEKTVEELRRQLREEIDASVAAAVVARQAASDVQTAMKTSPPPPPGKP